MHYKAIITFNKENAENSEEARTYAHQFLIDEGFCAESGRFNCPIGDWFVIGGRWSGCLSELDVEGDLYEEVRKMLKIKKDDFLSTDDVEKNKKKIQELWLKMGGKGLNPLGRNAYSDYGYDDDSAIVDKKIYDKLLKEHKGECDDGEHFWDLDYDEVSKDFIGNKWIVIVDYHN